MKFLTDRLTYKLTAGRKLHDPAERHRVGLIVSWVSISGNLALTLLKLVFGLITNSIALMADAVHSASDIISSLVVLVGFTLAKKKPDREHPHGHGRSEYLAGLIIGAMLTGAGVVFAYNASTRFLEDVTIQPSIPAITAVLAAILIKEFLFYFSARMGRLINSDTIAGDAWHHRTDSMSSVMVLIALVGSYLGLHYLDAIFGFTIALFIIYAGYKIARNSGSRLLGKAPGKELQKGVIDCAKEVKGVVDVHNLEIHDYGSWKVITMHIEVSGDLSLERAHRIAHQVEDQVSDNYHCDTIVHLDPC